MKTGFAILFFLFLSLPGRSQSSLTDSLKHIVWSQPDDVILYDIYGKLSNYYLETEMDSALVYIEKSLLIAKRNSKKLNEAASLTGKGLVLRHLGRYPEALQCYFEAFEIAGDPGSEKEFWTLPTWMFAAGHSPGDTRRIVLGNIHMGLANLYVRAGNPALLTYHFAEARRIGTERKAHTFLYYLDATMGIAYKNLGLLDSALYFEQEALSLASRFRFKENLSRVLAYIGEINFTRGNTGEARAYYHAGLQAGFEEQNLVSAVINYFGLTKSFIAENDNDSSLYYARKALGSLKKVGSLAGTVWNPATAYENLFVIFKRRKDTDSSFKYMELTIKAKDSLYHYREQSTARFQDLILQDQIRIRELEKARMQFKSQVRFYLMLGGIGLLLLLAFFFHRSKLQKQRAKEKIEKAYDELKSTQAQLIQAEKMASLGELTAGIAHEIQNPLNFVNNFSELNKELIDEMQQEIDKGHLADVKSISKDIRENEEKIYHHGRRADAIVKSMLQHSRNSSGQKELTDINVLADECLRLSYHGIRAKDKSFNSATQTEFDSKIPLVPVVPQEIGRVLLNLLTNAFYSVMQKKKQLGNDYDPMVVLKTSLQASPSGKAGGIIVSVWDNGKGIPQNVIDKIFQPFFTTKPTGEGTGLGLSMSYDIVTKAHGGEFRVKSAEGEWAEFTIILPI